MPELPEVETIRRDLDKLISGLEIAKAEIRDKKVFRGDKEKLKGVSISCVDRAGKLLIFEMENSCFLLIHLKMTGQLIFSSPNTLIGGGHSFKKEGDFQDKIGGDLPNKYTRFIFYFQNGGKLFFNDIRRFGYVKLAGAKQKEEAVSRLGPEPLKEKIKPEELEKVLKNRKISLKSALLNQKIISGIGNIYADEILFEAGLDPCRSVAGLTSEEIGRLAVSARNIIKKAVKFRGTTFSNYRDGKGKRGNFETFLKVYGQEGEKCPECSGRIKKVVLVNRGTHYCPKCQK